MKKLIALLLALVMIVGLVACGAKEEAAAPAATQAAKEEAPAAEKEAAAKEEVTLTFSHYYLEDDRSANAEIDAFWTSVEAFQAENPDINVEFSTMYQGDYETKIQTQASVGEMPDLFFVKGSWIKNFQKNDLMLDFTEIINNYEYADRFRAGVFDAGTCDGKIYGMPLDMGVTSIVFYNEAMWKEAGYDAFPTTWDELFAAEEKFEQMGLHTIAFGNKDQWPAESCILSALGDRYTGSEWTYSIIANDGNAKFTDPEFVDALAMLQRMGTLFNEDVNVITYNQGDDYYCNGEAAAQIEGNWNLGYLLATADEEVLANTKVAVLPGVEGGKGDANATSGGTTWYLCINSQLTGEKLDAAIALALKVSGYDYAQTLMDTYGVAAPIEVDADPSKFDALTQEYMELVANTSYTPVYDAMMDGAVIEVMNSGIQELLNGSITPEDLAAAIQAEQDKLS